MKMINNTVKISCESKDFLNLGELTEFQGELKIRNDANITKIVNSIKEYGFSFPFFVWKDNGENKVLDGHGRLLALHKLDELGFLIPPLPVVYVNCEDEKSAKDLLLRLNSQYGKMTKESVLEFIGDYEIETDNFELPCGIIDFSDTEEPDIETDGDEEGIDLKEKYEVIITCKNSKEQEMIFYKLTDEGYNVKVSTM